MNSFDRAVAALEQPVGGKVTLAQLIAEGRVTPALDPNTEDLPMPVASSTGASATEALLEERELSRR